MTWIHGVDLSHYQADSLVPWTQLAASSKFVIVKASDGVSKDPGCIDHVNHVRGLGMTVGLYHFFRDALSVQQQMDTFVQIADECKLQPGDLLPAIDIEDYPGHQIGPQTSEPAEQWCERATDIWGSAIVYLTQRDWGRMGSPAWVLAYSLWCAHYTGRELPGPATPDHRSWRIWQYAVHPYAPGVWTNDFKAARAIDHNWALDPLPLISEPGQIIAEPEIDHHEPSYITDVDWAEFQAARTAAVTSEDT